MTKAQERVVCRFVNPLEPPAVLYDVGVGMKSEWQAIPEVFPGMQIFGTEPNPICRDYALANGFPPDCLREEAVTCKKGSVEFYQTETPMRSGLLDRGCKEKIKVPCIRLDEFDAWAGSPDRILLWADVEGSELDVLKSGLDLLQSKRVWWINVEEMFPCYIQEMRKKGLNWPSRQEVQEFLQGYNYRKVFTYGVQARVKKDKQGKQEHQPVLQDAIYMSREARISINRHVRYLKEANLV